MTNDREDLEARIAAYIDGELPPADAARLEVFLANTDPKLAEQVIGMIGDRHQLRALPKARAPEDLAARIVEQVERATLLNNVEHLATHHRPWWQSRLAVAAGVLLVLGGFSYFILEALHPANPAWQAALETQRATPPLPAASPMLAAAPAMKDAEQPAAAPPAEAVPESPPALAAGAASTLPAPLSQVASATIDQPVLLTLAAQTPEEITRLHAALDTLAGDVTSSRARFRPQGARQNKAMIDSQIQTTQPARQDDNLQQSQANAENTVAPTIPTPSQNGAAQNGEHEQPLVYHLSLRPAQLERLTQEFQVQTLTRDNQPFTLSAQQASATEPATTAPSSDATPLECIITIVPPASMTRPEPPAQ